MQPNDNLDDLFRQQLGGHATEPGADLWARLQAGAPAGEAAPDPLDAQFRGGLGGHATPPRRELWERLEDEHLRPRQRRRPVVAWGRLAVAASLLLLVLGGGAGLWRGWWGQRSEPLATRRLLPAAGAGQPRPAPLAGPASLAAATRPARAAVVAANTTAGPTAAGAAPQAGAGPAARAPRGRAQAAALALVAAETKKRRNFSAGRATGQAASPSDIPVASTSRPRRAATAQRPVPALPSQQPDAATGTLTRDGGRNTPPGQPSPAPAETYVVEVEVRRGPDPGPPAPAPAAVAEAGPARRRVRVVGLLRQADHLLHGEPASLTDATAEAEPITLQARLGNRLISKTIRL